MTSVVALERATRWTSSISRCMGSLTMIAVIPRNTWEGASAKGTLDADDRAASGIIWVSVSSILPNRAPIGPPGNTLRNLGIGPEACASLSQNHGQESAILSRNEYPAEFILWELKAQSSGRNLASERGDAGRS